MCLCIVLILAAVYGTIFLQCLHIVLVLSVNRLLFIFSTGYPKCCQTNKLKVAEASSMLIFSDCCSCFPFLHITAPHRSQTEAWIAYCLIGFCPVPTRQLFSFNEKYCHDLISRDLVTPLLDMLSVQPTIERFKSNLQQLAATCYEKQSKMFTYCGDDVQCVEAII